MIFEEEKIRHSASCVKLFKSPKSKIKIVFAMLLIAKNGSGSSPPPKKKFNIKIPFLIITFNRKLYEKLKIY